MIHTALSSSIPGNCVRQLLCPPPSPAIWQTHPVLFMLPLPHQSKAGSGKEGDFNAFFYTLVSRDTQVHACVRRGS